MATFGEVWKRVSLHAPTAEAFLCRDWVQTAYNRLADSRRWGWTVRQSVESWAAAREIAFTGTAGSVAITSTADFLSADEGRSLKVGTGPLRTIVSVVDTSTAYLDLPLVTTGDQEGLILDGYLTTPATFGSFIMVTLPAQQKVVPWWKSIAELNAMDPARSQGHGPAPLALGAANFSQYPITAGQPRYEYWPTAQSAGSVYTWWAARPPRLVDESPFYGVLADRTDVLVTGALAECAKWPGNGEVKNPYFSLSLASALMQDFDKGILQLDLRDDDQFQQSFESLPWALWDSWGTTLSDVMARQLDVPDGYYGNYPYL